MTLHVEEVFINFITQMLLAGVPDSIVDATVCHQRCLAKEYELFEGMCFRQWY
ncbi:MAG: hypothetical protein QFX35_01145 [Candidatus Verstraetearchaeota archaeon]|nr:hypothetical protein [Candidatus Verstraetearchaeota archaeon]